MSDEEPERKEMKFKGGKPRFRFLTGDVNWLDYGGKWISQRFNNGEFNWYFVMRLDNLIECCGEREAKEAGGKYVVDVQVIAPDEYKEPESVLRCHGMENNPEYAWDKLTDVMKVELISGAASGAQVFSQIGDNYKLLFKAAKKAAMESEFLFGCAMDKVQNKIGSTGWDFLKGEILAGLGRYAKSDDRSDPTKNLMLKISGVENG